MSEMTSNIIGSNFSSTVLSNESVGQELFTTLKKSDPKEVIFIDALTDEHYTYGQILEWSIKLAIHLKELGIQELDRVAILSNVTIENIICLLATFYIGATLCPLNPEYSLDEMEHGFSISKPKLIFSNEQALLHVNKLRKHSTTIKYVVPMDKLGNGTGILNKLMSSNMEVASFSSARVAPEEVALILTSSGTSGLPKGAMLTHYNVKHSFTYCAEEDLFAFSNNDSIILCVPLFHVFGFLVALNVLLLGTRTVLLEKFKPDVYLNSIPKYNVTKLFVAPPLLVFLAKHPAVVDYDLSSLEEIFCGAGSTGQETEELVKQRLNLECIRQMYGLTETGGVVTLSPTKNKVSGSIGKVVNCQMKVVDDYGKNLSANEVGEICIRSLGNMKGYVGNSEDIFDNDGFLHSGDLGYYDEEGYFYIIDRIKELVKYKGFQVAPASLENIIMKHPNVRDVAVVGKYHERFGEVAVAFIIKENNVDLDEKEIIDFVGGQVSVNNQLHGGVRFVDEIPKNAGGKILRRHLREVLRKE